MLVFGLAGRLQYVPTLLRELLLSESEGMVERTLYVEPADTQQRGRINTSDGPIRIRVQCRCDPGNEEEEEVEECALRRQLQYPSVCVTDALPGLNLE